jgi:type IV pilus assembly protein PilX
MNSLRQLQSANQQTGAVLFISLIMLLLITLIGTTAIQTTTLDEKVTANLRNENMAFQAAETTLRQGERALSIWPLPKDKPAPNNNGKTYRDKATNKDKTLPYVCKFNELHTDSSKANFDPDKTTPWWQLSDRKDLAWWRDKSDGAGGGESHTYKLAMQLLGINTAADLVRDPDKKSRDPMYVIEYISYVPDNLAWGSYENPSTGRDYYLITARSMGGSNDMVVFLQTVFKGRYE